MTAFGKQGDVLMDRSIRPAGDDSRDNRTAKSARVPSFRKWLSNSTYLTGCASIGRVAASLLLVISSNAYAFPVSGVVSAGSATITGSANALVINQASQNAAINWQSFNIAPNESVQFVQPNSSAVALNRVLGPD